MITPHKYLNLDISVINVGAVIIEELKSNKIVQYEELLSSVISSLEDEKIKEVFPYAINFLFLLGKINYLEGDLDAFELNEISDEVK